MTKVNDTIYLKLTDCCKELGISRQSLTKILKEKNHLFRITGLGRDWYIREIDWQTFKESRIRQ